MLRRFSSYLLLVGLFFILLILYSSGRSSSILRPAEGASQEPASFLGQIPTSLVPDLHFSFRTASHKPQEQQNSTSGQSSWYSHWTWLNPFSSSITLDENRSVLPPLALRPPVYTYYDSELRKEAPNIEVDKQLLLTWRRAWWAHGFRPVVLGKAEARNNPLYGRLKESGLEDDLASEVNRWLAWGHMGSGLLSSWYCFPMAASDDPLLSYLRRGQFPGLTQFEGLGNGLFAGEKQDVNSAIQEVLASDKLESAKSMVEAISQSRILTEKATAIARYDIATCKAKYPALAEKLHQSELEGRLALNALVNSHLHNTWQNVFSSGIAVLKPLPAHSTAQIAPSLHLANLLAQCPETLVPASCPPNRPKCSPCVSSRMQVTTPAGFRNSSTVYSIGTVPHPYTTIMLNNQSDAITVRHVRRYTNRDPWLMAISKEILGAGRHGPSRVVKFKDAVASEYSRSRGLWLTAEELPPSGPASDQEPFPEDWLANLDWHFGFSIPRTAINHGESVTPVPGPERRPKTKPGYPEERKKSYDPDPPNDEQLAIEVDLLGKASRSMTAEEEGVRQIRNVAEAWNLADAEAWRFTRAYQARSVVERKKWEEEEHGFGAEGRGNSRWW